MLKLIIIIFSVITYRYLMDKALTYLLSIRKKPNEFGELHKGVVMSF